MDDTQHQRAVFPLGETMEITARKPSEGQALALMPLRRTTTESEGREILRRLLLVLSTLTGSEQWERIEDALITEEIEAADLIAFARQLISFDGWDAEPKGDPGLGQPDPAPRTPRRV